ncbi:MAG: hypothetical protein HY243_19140 [Proteobacteria bacterium]|nr:hypothetical protein [Pseudomonadota bacterium]
MSSVSGLLAIIAGVLTALLALMMTSSSGSGTSMLVTITISVTFLIAGCLGVAGRYQGFLAGVWLTMLLAFVALLFAADADMGLMDGGLFIFAVFFYLLAGTLLAITGWHESRRELRSAIARRVSVTPCKKVSVSLPLIGDSHACRFFA